MDDAFCCLLCEEKYHKASFRVKFGFVSLVLNLLLVPQLALLLFSSSFLFNNSFRIYSIPEKTKWLTTLFTNFPLT